MPDWYQEERESLIDATREIAIAIRELKDSQEDHRLTAVLDLIQTDPHQWSARPCATCKAVSAIVGKGRSAAARGALSP